ncbi:metal ABC transporter permease, partial [Bacillus cereus group sp. Bce006]|uniref:metal ABC transporter permease n=1 Tax=Bacillus cereus group sp. Bce006 TaxID=3445255 RepID=UPI003F69BEEE
DRFTTMLLISTSVGVVSAVLGLWLSYAFDVASGGTIVLVATSCFFLALLFSPRHGVLMRHWRHRRIA